MSQETDDLRNQIDNMLCDWGRERTVFTNQIARLSTERGILREALAFYADSRRWENEDTGIGEMRGEALDFGHAARTALFDSDQLNLQP